MFAAKMQLVFLCEFRNDTKQLVSHSLHVLYMQSWAITYHGLLTLVWLVGACSLWVLPDTRKYTLRLTPLICAYALLLILLQYSCFLVLRVPAVAGSFLNDGVNEVLRTIGGHRENPSLPQQPPSHAATSLPHVLPDNASIATGAGVLRARSGPLLASGAVPVAYGVTPAFKADPTLASNFTDLATLLGFYPKPNLEFITLSAQVCAHFSTYTVRV